MSDFWLGALVGFLAGSSLIGVVLRLLVDSWSKRSERLVLFYPTKEDGL